MTLDEIIKHAVRLSASDRHAYLSQVLDSRNADFFSSRSKRRFRIQSITSDASNCRLNIERLDTEAIFDAPVEELHTKFKKGIWVPVYKQPKRKLNF